MSLEQQQQLFEYADKAKGDACLGEMHASSWHTDPKHFGFVAARYTFVAKMLKGKRKVLEVGCGDTTGARIVRDFVDELHGIDLKVYSEPCIPVRKYDILKGPLLPTPLYDAAYSLDVLEHIDPKDEDAFVCNVRDSVDEHGGVVIIGMPSKESQVYASPISREHHVNCKTEDELRGLMLKHFRNVLLFGMNDSTLHTGFGGMCHYRLCIATGARA